MFKNAGLKSKKEAAQRLMDGEIFYHNGTIIFYNENYSSPFRYESIDLKQAWKNYAEWQIKVEWYESIPKEGILCWVKYKEEENDPVVDIITGYREGRFISFTSKFSIWKYARPLTKNEIEVYLKNAP